ncbi:hypothetical protein [Flavobacterium soli]|uniref:hypothetical protein n=1 Tax=Flavobacterium soli TaxID=344881 RepID=UPI000416A2E8|nr:hypothetical protein [Flavobacterium soli]
MNELWQLYKSKTWVEPFLVYSIYLFILVTVVLFVLIMISRSTKIRNERLIRKYEISIEKMLFSILFGTENYGSIKKEEDFISLNQKPLFRNQLLESVINLHQNYEGVYAKKLESFYFESNLINDSFEKLKSRHWEIKCKGIKELAEMNVSKIFNTLVKISKSKNKTLKITALNACIKLNGTNGITHLIDHKDPIDTWTQLNILSAFKKGNIENTNGIELLLTSKNKTVVSLGLKIIQTLYLSQKAVFINELIATTNSEKIKSEAKNVLHLFVNPKSSKV